MQGVRRGEHLTAQSAKVPVQGVRRGGHLPAQSEEGQVQAALLMDLHASVEELSARSGSRSALASRSGLLSAL